MKKLIAVLLSLVMMFSLTSCALSSIAGNIIGKIIDREGEKDSGEEENSLPQLRPFAPNGAPNGGSSEGNRPDDSDCDDKALIVSIHSIEDWDKLGVPSDDYSYEIFSAFLSGDGYAYERALNPYGELTGVYKSYSDLVFGDYTIYADNTYLETGGYSILSIKFEILKGTEGFPPGKYDFVLSEYDGSFYRNYSIKERSEPEKAVLTLLSYMCDYTADGWQFDDYKCYYLTEYIITQLGGGYGAYVTGEDIVSYAERCLGIESFTPSDWCFSAEYGLYTVYGHGGRSICAEVAESSGDKLTEEYTVVVQFYADPTETVLSHRISYSLHKSGDEWVFTDCQPISWGEFEPRCMVY